MENQHYYKSLDVLRIILMALIIVVFYGDPTGMSDKLTIPMNFAPGCIFAIYGYVVLRENVDYAKRIKRVFKAFLIMFVVYGILAAGYFALLARTFGVPFVDVLKAMLNKRTIFEFVVLNVWPISLGSSIWMVQAVLYALIVLWVLDRKLGLLKKFTGILCFLLFAAAVLFGECAAVWNFDFHGYTYIPGNFITKALPYMLLGKLLHKYRPKLQRLNNAALLAIALAGVGMCFGEVFILTALNKLDYIGGFIGHIPMTAAMMELFLRINKFFQMRRVIRFDKVLYYGYNPLGEILLMFISMNFGIIGDLYPFVGVIMAVIFAAIYAVLRYRPDVKKALRKTERNIQILNESVQEQQEWRAAHKTSAREKWRRVKHGFDKFTFRPDLKRSMRRMEERKEMRRAYREEQRKWKAARRRKKLKRWFRK